MSISTSTNHMNIRTSQMNSSKRFVVCVSRLERPSSLPSSNAWYLLWCHPLSADHAWIWCLLASPKSFFTEFLAGLVRMILYCTTVCGLFTIFPIFNWLRLDLGDNCCNMLYISVLSKACLHFQRSGLPPFVCFCKESSKNRPSCQWRKGGPGVQAAIIFGFLCNYQLAFVGTVWHCKTYVGSIELTSSVFNLQPCFAALNYILQLWWAWMFFIGFRLPCSFWHLLAQLWSSYSKFPLQSHELWDRRLTERGIPQVFGAPCAAHYLLTIICCIAQVLHVILFSRPSGQILKVSCFFKKHFT